MFLASNQIDEHFKFCVSYDLGAGIQGLCFLGIGVVFSPVLFQSPGGADIERGIKRLFSSGCCSGIVF
jgi:hypothetical protein